MSASPPDSHDGCPETQNSGPASSSAKATTRSTKKRTKTGCLTCRKRRIKCGEEKPVCNNCIKSKRLCEGYNQRVVFKHPVGGFHRPGVGTDPNQSASSIQHYYDQGLYSGPGSTHLPIAPRPYQDPVSVDAAATHVTSVGSHYDTSGHLLPGTHQTPVSGAETAWATHLQSLQGQPTRSHSFSNIPTSVPDNARRLSSDQPQLRNALPTSWEHHPTRPGVSPEAWYLANASRQSPDNAQYFPSYRSDYLDIQAQIQALQKEQPTMPADPNTRKFSSFGFSQRPSFDVTIPLPTEPVPPPGAAMQDEDEDDDDDPFDVEMDDSPGPVTSPAQAEKDYSLLMAVHASQDLRRYRTFTTFLNEPNVLATYRPSHSASPLTDEKTARLFCHFVTSTGPSLSIFERQATNSSIIFSGLPIPTAQQALWSYTLPTIALNHPPLMHAILALSAIHISKLQQSSIGPSIKHFQYALRRVSKLIGLPKRRNEVSTLATSLAVTFYEIMSADHSKWSIHLAGAKILVMEVDFAGTTRLIRAMRAQAKARISHAKEIGYGDPNAAAGVPAALLVEKDWEIDESLISGLTGIRVRYDQQWQSNGPSYFSKELTQRDIEDYKIRSDLYWWYCKQDIFQSMISGNRLLMPYEHWVYCPPRGQISRLDTIYATMDHLCLLMARLTDFGAKDQKRKRRHISAHGGQWRPPPGLFKASPNTPHPQGPGPPASSQARTTPNSAGEPPRGVPTALVASSHQGSSEQGPKAHPPETNRTGVAIGGTRGGRPANSTAPRANPGDPPMYGMMPPPTGPIEMPSAFNVMTANLNDPGLQSYPAEAYSNISYDSQSGEGYPVPSSSTQPTGPAKDLEIELQAAITEHAAIASAFDLFASSMTPEFQPLASDAAPPIGTPFGPALQYRTHHIACIWTLYNAGRILLHRMHPHMPPAAMIAASVAARQTMTYAQTIGKICAGLYYPQRDSLRTGRLNPALGAALMESTFPLFFGAVQFMDPAQRGWTISKLRDIARLTGWQTSAAIAAGCEITWEKLGKAAKGPPYRPTMDRENRDERVSGKEKKRREKKGAMTSDEMEKEDRGGERQRGDDDEEETQDEEQTEEEDEEDEDEAEDEEEPPATINHDRRLISSNANARVHWALGILSVDEDIAKLDLGNT